MFTHRQLLRSTVSLAVLATGIIATSTQAGPLGAAGAIGGGLSGGAAPRHLDVAGQAGARGAATLPRGDKAHETAGAATGAAVSKAGEAKAQASGKTALSGAAKAGAATPAGDASAGGSAQASREHGAVNAGASAQGSMRR
jgi:hypothetical protein